MVVVSEPSRPFSVLLEGEFQCNKAATIENRNDHLQLNGGVNSTEHNSPRIVKKTRLMCAVPELDDIILFRSWVSPWRNAVEVGKRRWRKWWWWQEWWRGKKVTFSSALDVIRSEVIQLSVSVQSVRPKVDLINLSPHPARVVLSSCCCRCASMWMVNFRVFYNYHKYELIGNLRWRAFNEIFIYIQKSVRDVIPLHTMWLVN